MRSNKVNVLKKMLGMLLVAPVMLSLSLFATDPVHHWKLDETAGPTYVDSIGGADGTCTLPDGCPTSIDGQIYGAQSFDGNDRMEITNTANFDWTSDANVTIEFWMKSSNIPAVFNDVMIGRGQGVSRPLWYVGVAPVTGTIVAQVLDGNGDSGVGTGKVGNTIIANNSGQWYHIAYVLKPGMVRIFVNGEYDFNITRTPSDLVSPDANVTIGNLDYTTTIDWSYTGELDDIKLYATDLNGSTIKEHYQYGLNKPHLAVVTPVPTPTTDTTPDFTFSSDENGTITYGGSCTSTETNATYGDNTITFSELSFGTYNDCNITVTIADGNSSVLLVPAFEVLEVDTTPPTLAEVTAVTSPTDDNTPDYTFSSDEAGTITYGGSCASATTAAIAGNNTITFDTLADGVYGDCTITVTDAANNSSDSLLVTEFVVDTTVPEPEPEPEPIVSNGDGGGCTYNPNSKNFDMMFLLMIALGLFYPFRRRFIK